MWLRQRITIFEIVQTVIAFLLAAFSLLGSGLPVRASLGIFCLVFSAAGYVAAFVRFDRLPEQRNYHVYATWSALLLLAGSFLVSAAAAAGGVLERGRHSWPRWLASGGIA